MKRLSVLLLIVVLSSTLCACESRNFDESLSAIFQKEQKTDEKEKIDDSSVENHMENTAIDAVDNNSSTLEEEETTVVDPYVELIMYEKTKDTYVDGKEFSYWIVTKRNSVEEGYVTITKYKGQEAQVVIPETLDGYPVVGLWNSAFEGCDFVTDIQFPQTLRKLIFDNFSGGEVEKYFTDTQWYKNLPDGLYYAGPVCLGYKGVMPAGTTVILKEGTIAVGADAFLSVADSIVDIEFPESLRYLGGYCFSGSQIQEVAISSSWQHYGGAFIHCGNLKKVSFEEGVTKISTSAFYQCYALEEVVLPSTLQIIEGSAFYECTALKSIEMPENLQGINSYAFYGSGLTFVDLNQGLSYIDDGAFASCMNLKSLYVPKSVQNFGEGPYGYEGAFNNLHLMEDGFVVYVEEESSAFNMAKYWGMKYEIYTSVE